MQIYTVPEAPNGTVYMPGVSNCLFNFTLQGNDTSSLGSVGVLIVAGDKHLQVHINDLPSYFDQDISIHLPRICTAPNEDIRSAVFGMFGNVNELLVTEVLERLSDCEKGEPSLVKYFGRSARLIFNSSAASECHKIKLIIIILLSLPSPSTILCFQSGGLMSPAQCKAFDTGMKYFINSPAGILLFLGVQSAVL